MTEGLPAAISFLTPPPCDAGERIAWLPFSKTGINFYLDLYLETQGDLAAEHCVQINTLECRVFLGLRFCDGCLCVLLHVVLNPNKGRSI